jgi:selenocysteine lyase/cysteine desulfurase
VLVERARERVLRWLDADPEAYVVVFTANATAALKLVGEAYPFAPERPLLLAVDNHNSVHGIREYARRAGAPVHDLPLTGELRLDEPEARLEAMAWRGLSAGLLAYPAQSNFSGVRHPLALVQRARDLGLDVLLDAAAYLPTSALSLREVPADFVALSCYKLFGFPTGVGALVARREALSRLHRPWFAGGTVEWVSVQLGEHSLRAGADGFEDGTGNFLGIAGLASGFDLLDEIGMARLTARVHHLTERLLAGLRSLTHPDGRPIVEIYGPGDVVDRGGTVSLNVHDAAGRIVSFEAVETACREALVSVRAGCFCNPGAAEHAFGFERERTARCLERARREGFTIGRFRACLGDTPVGAVRVSVGAPTVERDLDRLVEVLARWRGRYLADSSFA